MRVLAQLLHEMDGVGGTSASGERAHVIVLGATNRPDLIDAALLRPGRFDRLLYVGLPERPARLAVLSVHTRASPLGDDVDLERIAASTAGYSGAELAAVCREAALAALSESLGAREVCARHFEAALDAVRPRTPGALLDLYARYQRGTAHHPGQGAVPPGASHGGGAGSGFVFAPPKGAGSGEGQGAAGAPAVEAALARLSVS
jgi:transitional endoplasmic reticulum ATPase